MPPRRQPPPKAESKAGLVIALVFFVLTTIIVSVVAYVGFDGQEALKKQAAEAKKAKEEAELQYGIIRTQLLVNQVIAGIEQPPKDEDLRAYAANKAFADELRKVNTTFEGLGVTWDAQGGKPPVTTQALIKELKAAREAADKGTNNALTKADEAKNTYEAKEKTAEEAKKAALAKTAAAEAAQVVAQAKAQDAEKSNADKIADLGAKLKDTVAKKETNDADNARIIKRKDVEIAEEKTYNTRLVQAQEANRQKVILKDREHGIVSKVDAENNMAFLNLGSADQVRPSLSFSILMPHDLSEIREDTPLPKKATVEVVQVLGAHLSRARIKYADDINPIKNPVEMGDKLYKPGWNKGQPIKWALIGHFDINGFGSDETRLLAQRAANQGILIQAYFNLATLQWVGEFTHDIDYVILGGMPDGTTTRMIGEERSKVIEGRILGELEKAKNMRVMVVRAAQFLPAAGIDLPRHPLPAQFPSGTGGAPAAGAVPAGPAAPVPGVPMPKPVPKEDDK